MNLRSVVVGGSAETNQELLPKSTHVPEGISVRWEWLLKGLFKGNKSRI